ncbi:MAG: PTS sugar transporter subunit IIA [Planctomycetota bacterium]
MRLQDLFPKSALQLDLKARTKDEAIRELIATLVSGGQIEESSTADAEAAVEEREQQGSTGIGRGLAIPHAKSCSFLSGIVGVFGRSAEGIEYNSVDGEPVRVLFLILSGSDHGDDHVAALRRIAQLGRDEATVNFLAGRTTDDGIHEIFEEVDG